MLASLWWYLYRNDDVVEYYYAIETDPRIEPDPRG